MAVLLGMRGLGFILVLLPKESQNLSCMNMSQTQNLRRRLVVIIIYFPTPTAERVSESKLAPKRLRD